MNATQLKAAIVDTLARNLHILAKEDSATTTDGAQWVRVSNVERMHEAAAGNLAQFLAVADADDSEPATADPVAVSAAKACIGTDATPQRTEKNQKPL